jgi:hypothetical protein
VSKDKQESRGRQRASRLNYEPVSLDKLTELARLAKEAGWTPAQVRAALEALHLEAQDETNKPEA